MCIPNDCPPQAIFLDLALCECNFPLKNNVFYCIWVLKSLKFSGLRPAKYRFLSSQIPIILIFFLPDTNNPRPPPPPPGGYEKHCLRPNVSLFFSIWYPMTTSLMVRLSPGPSSENRGTQRPPLRSRQRWPHPGVQTWGAGR